MILQPVVRVSTLVLAAAVAHTLWAQTGDLDTQLMLCTFKLSNPGSTATAFMLSRPTPHDAQKTQYILVTAEHVLRLMKGEQATMIFRKREADGSYSKSPQPLQVRRQGKDLWTKHPTADVAAMCVSLPAGVSFPEISLDCLASDSDLQKYEVHPGDLIRCIGYPHPNQFEPNEAGFAVTRTGCIASYPLLPTKKTKTFLIDCNTFEGDSGAAVYLSENNRTYGGATQAGQVRLILGLIHGQHFLDEEFKSSYQNLKNRYRLGLAIVVHAAAIRETVDLLPQMP